MLLTSYPLCPERLIDPIGAQYELYEKVKLSLSTVQTHFSSTINIRGIDATDLFSMNTLLGSAIEVQTVEALKNMRAIWDPDGLWAEYDFFRYPQSFPDVRLQKCHGDDEPVIGIELKSWYLLSKEAEPSFRFKTTAEACAPYDLVAIIPWSLSDVVSGTPVVHAPFIEQAKHVANMRNYYWLNTRVGGVPTAKDHIEVPEGKAIHPYPPANSIITDEPVYDKGKNFGRIGRVHNLIGDWTNQCLGTLLAGISAMDWIKFLKAHTESASVVSFDSIESDSIQLDDLKAASKIIDDLVSHLS